MSTRVTQVDEQPLQYHRNMTAPAIAAGQEGARYQYRFFWREALPMLYVEPPLVEKVVMEHRDIAAVDDVVVYYTKPGVTDAGLLVRVDYYQLKFHVSQAHCIAYTDLIDPSFTGTTRSLLERFAASWKELRDHETNIRLNLVTNWPWCPTDPIAALIRDAGALHEDFFTKSLGSNVGKVRLAWREHLTMLDDEDFETFIRQLRLCARAVSQREAEEWLADRCALAGLQRPNPAENHSPYDDLAGRLLAQGRREFTRTELAALVKQENLVALSAVPFRSTCAIRSFRRFAHVPETEARVVVDLTDLFNGRNPIDEAVWPQTVPSRLNAALAAIDALPKPVQVALDTHLSIGWLAGTLLDAKAGIPVLLRQKSYAGVSLWDTSKSEFDREQTWQVSEDMFGEGGEIAVAISITHDISSEVRQAVTALVPVIGRLIHVRLPKLGGDAIKSGEHACALADDLTRVLHRMVHELQAPRTHVFAACPVSFAFLLGQRSAAIGPVTIYEYDFGGTRAYRPAAAT